MLQKNTLFKIWPLLLYLNFFHSNYIQAQCNVIVDAGPDQTECNIPATFQLQGSVSSSNPILSTSWTPITGLSDPSSLNPTATVAGSTTYTLTATSIDFSNNLVINGDFSGGNSGFTTDYILNTNPSIPANQLVEGQYSIGTNPAPMHINWVNCGDHTTGNGNMMLVNGHETANQNVWCQTVNVIPNTDYAFSAWVTSVDPNGPCLIQFNINGTPLGAGNVALSTTCLWLNFFEVWNSGSNTTATICIQDLNTIEMGNDFAIDDIVFAPTCEVTDEVTLTPSIVTALAMNDGPVFCEGETMNLSATGGVTYQWSGPDGFSGNGASVAVSNLTAQSGGNYSVTVTDGDGCTAVANTFAIMLPSVMVNLSDTTCDPNSAGVFTQNLTDINGCDSTVVTTVTLVSSNIINLSDTTCDPNAAGVFTQNLLNQFGCDSTVITTVTLVSSNTVNLTDTTCDPNSAGVFTQDLTNQFGCDSTVITTITLASSNTINLTDTTCDPNSTGVFTQDLTNEFGCDSTVITTVTLVSSNTINLTDTTCDPNSAGVFTQNLTNEFGCDSTVITTITLNPTSLINLTETTCDSTMAGVFTQNLTNQFGCDSTVITTITLNPTNLINLTETTCDSTMAGVFTQNLTNQFGCDSTVITTITLNPTSLINLTDTTCDSTAAGVFTQDLTNQFGCDSTVITTIILNPNHIVNFTEMTCDSTTAGIFTQNLTNQFGCDSTIITTINYEEEIIVNLSEITCDSTEAGIFIQNLVSQTGCDSTVITTVNLAPSNIVNLTDTTCDSSQVGIFTQNLTNEFGCDSTVVTTISLAPSNTVNISEMTCDAAEVGIFTEILTNQFGCDSVVITTINLAPSNTENITATTCDTSAVGIFTEVFVNQFGCDSTIITTVMLSQEIIVNLSDTTCEPSEVGVFTQNLMSVFGCDSTVITTVSLLPSDVINLTDTTCDPNSAGVFTQNLTNQFGCDSTVITTVNLNSSNIENLTETTCDPSEVGVFTEIYTNQFGCDSTVVITVTLLPSDVVNLMDMTCDTALVGAFTEMFTNQFGCDSTVITTMVLSPPNQCGVEVILVGSIIPCDENSGSLIVTATVGEAPFNYVLSGPTNINGAISMTNTPEIINDLPAGIYDITVTSSNGFTTTGQATITQNFPPEAFASITSNYNGTNISCAGNNDGSAIVDATGGLAPYQFEWSNGNISAEVNELIAGTYAVTVTDMNGCTDISDVILEDPVPLSISFVVNNLDCFSQNNGSIFTTTIGGTMPYIFSLNDNDTQISGDFNGLSAGGYEILAIDANGCSASEIIAINSPMPLTVDLGDDLFIDIGENVEIEATVNVPFDSLVSVFWQPLDSLECPGCLTQNITPIITSTYSISVTDANGCADEDALTIYVDRNKEIYVPNIFSPNGDGTNDIFMIFSKDDTVERIQSLQIFSRWGEVVYQQFGFPPNDPLYGWNGLHREEELNAAVFVWMAEILFTDGSIALFKGDVTLTK